MIVVSGWAAFHSAHVDRTTVSSSNATPASCSGPETAAPVKVSNTDEVRKSYIKKFEKVRAAPRDTTDLGRFDFKWAQIRVFCTPPVPADLTIDGEPVDRQTPYSGKIGAGPHRFAVVKPGYRVTSVVVSGPGGESRPAVDASGRVVVDVDADAEVRIQFQLEKDG